VVSQGEMRIFGVPSSAFMVVRTYAGVAPLELAVQDYWEGSLRHFCRSHKLPWREPGWLYRVKASG